MQLNLKLSHKGLSLVGLLLALELTFVGALANLLSQAEQAAQKEAHAKDIVGTTTHIFQLLYDAGNAAADFQMHNGGEAAVKVFDTASDKILPEFEKLRSLTEKNSAYHERIERIYKKGTKGLKLLKLALGMAQEGNMVGAGYVINKTDMKHLERDVMGDLRELMNEQEEILKDSPAKRKIHRDQVVQWLTVGVICNVLVAVIMGVLFVRGITGRLSVLVENTRRLAQGEALTAAMTGTDEIAHLDQVFHDMAAKLAEAQRKERALVENARDVICSLDESGNFFKVSPASVQVWGYTPDELVGKSFLQGVAAEDRQRSQKYYEQIIRGEIDHFENRVQKKDGSVVHILWSAHWSATENSAFCVAHDITDRKLAEELLRSSERRIRSIIDSMLVGLLVLNPNGTIESINPRITQITGFTAEELENNSILTLFPESRVPDAATFVANLNQKASGHVTEVYGTRKGGADLPLEVSLTEFHAIEGDRFLANVVDITERHEIERMKQEFVAMISHDLRTPLTSVQGFLELLADGVYGELTAQGVQRSEMAERNVSRLLRLINDLLEVTKLEAGKLDLHLAETRLEEIIERSVEAVRVFAEKHSVSLDAPIVPIQLIADGDRVERVLVNLLSNAIKFSPPQSVVKVVVEESQQWVEVKVQDTGRGIPASHIDAVFERFKQVEVNDAKKKGGTGLGLAICKAIIEQHGGNIGVTSEEGKGSTFWFRLPRTRTEQKPTPELADSRA